MPFAVASHPSLPRRTAARTVRHDPRSPPPCLPPHLSWSFQCALSASPSRVCSRWPQVLTPSGSLLILDDVLASGKTAAGCVDLVEQCATPAPMPQPSSATGFRQRTAHRRPCRRLRMAMVVLASGGAADLPRPTLFRVHRSGAKVKGCGFLIEKMHDGGRASLPRDALVVAVVRVCAHRQLRTQRSFACARRGRAGSRCRVTRPIEVSALSPAGTERDRWAHRVL